jgi:hypothetical protein
MFSSFNCRIVERISTILVSGVYTKNSGVNLNLMRIRSIQPLLDDTFIEVYRFSPIVDRMKYADVTYVQIIFNISLCYRLEGRGIESR